MTTRHLIQIPTARFDRVQRRTRTAAEKHGHVMSSFDPGKKYTKIVSVCKKCGKKIILRWDEDYNHDPVPTRELTSECKG